MKRTKYVCVVAKTSLYDKTQRVYTDEEGHLYIRTKDGYKCIDNLPCRQHMFMDRV